MDTGILAVAFLGGAATICACLTIMVLAYDRSIRKKKLTDRDENDWLFHNFHDKFYAAFIGKEPEGTIFGVDTRECAHFCRVMKEPDCTKKIIAMRLEGLFLFIFALAATYVLQPVPILAGVAAILGVFAITTLTVMPYSKLKSNVKNRLYEIEEALPRYLSLLSKALDLPIEQAIEVTAQSFPCALSSDLMDCCNSIRLGADGWQESLTRLAEVYQLDTFNGFVMDIIEAVVRKTYALEQNRLYVVEQEDARTKSLIIVPMVIFKIIPLMAIMLVPMLPSIMGM